MYGTIFVNENIQSDKNDKRNLRCLFDRKNKADMKY